MKIACERPWKGTLSSRDGITRRAQRYRSGAWFRPFEPTPYPPAQPNENIHHQPSQWDRGEGQECHIAPTALGKDCERLFGVSKTRGKVVRGFGGLRFNANFIRQAMHTRSEVHIAL